MGRPLFVVSLVWVAWVAAVAWGQEQTRTIPTSEIRPGMRGYGLTVLQGTAPERFDVEVIDVLRNFRPAQDLILIRTHHPVIDHAVTVAGMSGSPIYLEGRLAGAYAYGWTFGRDPVAGVTPIANMMAEIGRPVRSNAFPGAERLLPAAARPQANVSAAPDSSWLAGLPAYLGARRGALDALRDHAARLGLQLPIDSPRAAPQPQLEAVATPILLGGFAADASDWLGRCLTPFGLVPVQAGGGGRQTATAARFVDGGAIGVDLIRGDISATAVGTVTYVSGGRLVAFGHPMLNIGEVGLPTSLARILHVFASDERSFKIAESIGPLGTLVHDRQSAIVIDTSLVARTVPVTLRLHGVDDAPKTEWHIEVANHRMLTPMLTLASIINVLRATANDQTDVVYEARARVEFANRPAVEVTDVDYLRAGPNDAEALGSLRLFEILEAGFGNPFERVQVSGIALDLTLRFERDVFEIVEASFPVEEVDPGATVPIRLVLRKRDATETVRWLSVEIPTRLAGKTAEIRVEPGETLALEQPVPRTLSDLFGIIQRRLTSSSVVVSIALPARGLRMRGEVVTDLPASALDALASATVATPTQVLPSELRQVQDFGALLAGSARLRVNVRQTPRSP